MDMYMNIFCMQKYLKIRKINDDLFFIIFYNFLEKKMQNYK